MLAIKEWPTPNSITMVRIFHGLVSFYCYFVKDFSTITTPLTEIINKYIGINRKKNKKIHLIWWKRLCSTPLLDLLNFCKTFEIECDASGICIGVILMQKRHLIAYFSENLNGASLNYPPITKFSIF